MINKYKDKYINKSINKKYVYININIHMFICILYPPPLALLLGSSSDPRRDQRKIPDLVVAPVKTGGELTVTWLEMGGLHQWGYPKWLVSFMESPNQTG